MNTNPKPKREPIPMDEVMTWLTTNHPTIKAEPDRAWIWLIADLRGEKNKPARESLKAYGFKFAAAGHKLPCGTISHWAHSCQRPQAFKRKGQQAAPKNNGSFKARQTKPSNDTQRADPMEYTPQSVDEATMAEIAAAFA